MGIDKTSIFTMLPFFLRLWKYFGIFESVHKGSYGSKNPETMIMLGFGLSHTQIEKLWTQIEAE